MTTPKLPAIGLFVGLAVFTVVGAVTDRCTHALEETARSVNHTRAVLEALDGILIAMNDAIAARRGFELTGDEKQLAPYRGAVARVGRYRATAERLTADNARQQWRLARLRPLWDARLAQLDAAIRARRALGLDVARELALTSDGDVQSEGIRSLIDELQGEERALLDQRVEATRADARRLKLIMRGGFALGVALLLVAFLALRRELAYRAGLAVESARRYEEARGHSDDLREVNEQMVGTTIQAQELTAAAEAAQARTEERERELREVAEFRELFIGVVGHDLRNPLGAITVAASTLLRHGSLDEPGRKAVERIIGSSQRMTRLIAQLLDLTRVRLGGGFPVDPRPADLREVCAVVVEELDGAVQLELAGDLLGTWDPDRLVEALSNVAGNAVDHAAPGTAVVIAARADGAEVVVEISNQGSAIPPEVLPFIFEPFRKARARDKVVSGNLGLGLYIARQIALAHGGALDARCAGGTTTFVMRLPRAHAG